MYFIKHFIHLHLHAKDLFKDYPDSVNPEALSVKGLPSNSKKLRLDCNADYTHS